MKRWLFVLLPGLLVSFPFPSRTFAEDNPLKKVPTHDVIQKAKAGQSEFKEELGRRLIEGEGIPRDPVQGMDWLTEAAEDGRVEAQFHLAEAMISLRDDEVKRDYESAFLWCRKAADKGYAQAQLLLGLMYWSATGVAQDLHQARKILEPLAAKGDGKAECYLGWMDLFGEGREKDEAGGLRRLRHGAEKSHEGERLLGIAYQHGYGVQADEAEAAKWYQRSADHDDPVAPYFLGLLYLEGKGVPKDVKRGAELVRKSAVKGVSGAQWELGKLYETGVGVEQDGSMAVKWGQLAAKSLFVKVNFNPVVK